MTKNKLQHLNDHLFAEMERLSDEDLKGDELQSEIDRAAAIVRVSDQIIRTADVQLKTAKLYVEHGAYIEKHLPKIGTEHQPPKLVAKSNG